MNRMPNGSHDVYMQAKSKMERVFDCFVFTNEQAKCNKTTLTQRRQIS